MRPPSTFETLATLAPQDEGGDSKRAARKGYGMNRSPVGKLANVLSGTRKLVANRRGLDAIQPVSEID